MPFSFKEQIENDTNCPQKSKFICLYFRSRMTKLINCQHGSIWRERVQNSSPTTTTPWTQTSVHQTLVMIGTFVSQHLYNAKIFKVSSITNHKLITLISLISIKKDLKGTHAHFTCYSYLEINQLYGTLLHSPMKAWISTYRIHEMSTHGYCILIIYHALSHIQWIWLCFQVFTSVIWYLKMEQLIKVFILF